MAGQKRQWIAVTGALLIAASAPQIARAQTMGDVGAASAASNSMNAGSNSGTMAVGSRAMQDARRLGNNSSGYEERAGSGSSSSGSSSSGSSGSGSSGSGSSGSGSGEPNFPGVPGGSGSSGSGEGGGGAAAAPPPPKAVRWNKLTGMDYLRELLGSSTRGKATAKVTRKRFTSKHLTKKQVAKLPPKTRSKVIAQRYQKPPVGYLSFYLPQDRYKVTSNVWRYVSIEDDSARYPVKYYWAPNSPAFLRILAQRPAKSQPRYNRVIGFHTWQEAMLAGYRPDPVSKPAPAPQIVSLAAVSTRESLGRYVEFVYGGQISPAVFERNFRYITRVKGIVGARKDLKPYLKPTISQILLAATGVGEVPRQVGPRPPVVTISAGNPYGAGGSSSGGPATGGAYGGSEGGARYGGAPGVGSSSSSSSSSSSDSSRRE